MLSQTSEYALRAMVHLAANHGEALTTQQIAEATQVSPGYLAKVLQTLGRAGIISAQRGMRGGYTLMRSPGEVTLLEVVEAIDPIPRIRTCPLGIRSHGTQLCALHSRLDAAFAHLETVLGGSTLQDLMEDPNPSKPLCALPALAPEALKV